MVLMVNGGEKRWVPDVFIGHYRELGYTVEGEEAPPPIPSQPTENVADHAPQEETAATEAAAPSSFICPHCGKAYAKESSLKGHITRCHNSESFL